MRKLKLTREWLYAKSKHPNWPLNDEVKEILTNEKEKRVKWRENMEETDSKSRKECADRADEKGRVGVWKREKRTERRGRGEEEKKERNGKRGRSLFGGLRRR